MKPREYAAGAEKYGYLTELEQPKKPLKNLLPEIADSKYFLKNTRKYSFCFSELHSAQTLLESILRPPFNSEKNLLERW